MQVAVMASGTGSNFEAICQACESKELNFEIKALIVDKKCGAMEIAKKYQIDVVLIDFHSYPNKKAYNHALKQKLLNLDCDLICLAGYMRILTKDIVDLYEGQIINIHPSLLPKYPGLNAIEQAFDAKEIKTGVTTHYVDSNVDTGAIIKQEEFSIKDLSLPEIYVKLKPIEHRLYIDTLKLITGEK